MPAPDPETGLAVDDDGVLQRLRRGLLVGLGVGVLAGLVAGSLRALGLDSSLFLLQVETYGLASTLGRGLPALGDVPGLLGCVASAGALYALAIGFIGVALSLAPSRWVGRRLPGLLLGLWLGLELYWWTRPVVLPGLPATDPRRLAAAGVLLVLGVVLGLLVTRPALLARAPKLPYRALAAAVIAIGAVFLAVDLRRGAAIGSPNERNAQLPNIVVVVVDALRQDTLRCYGDERVHTPHIDRLAAEGALFERAFAPTPFTWPSFGTLLTGKVPRRHGLLKMAPGYSLPDNETLPTLLKSGLLEDGRELEPSDVVTGAFMTGTLSHGSGLLRGFDNYFEALVGHELVDVHSRWSRFRSGLLPWLVLNKLRQRADEQLVTSETVAWLRRHAGQRFMALVHLYSTHTPYDPPDEYRQNHLDPSYDGPFPAFYASHREAIEAGKYTPDEADIDQIRGLYLAGVEEADANIGRIVATLEELGVLDDTVVVVTADHGEALGEHGLWEHNWMIQNNLLVPLVVRHPATFSGGRRVTERVGLEDVVPTILAIAGIEAPPPATELEAQGIVPPDQRLVHAIDGVDLAGRSGVQRAYTFSENGLFKSIQDDRWKLVVRRELLAPGAFEKMLADADAERPRFFDLTNDPGENENLFEERTQDAERYHGLLLQHVARLPIRDDMVERSARDIRDEAIFRALGYGGGVGD